ncbi:MAG: glycosyltransferase [Desulfovibrio sp.]|jgi:glycosyltransferase involved in cell wall biosynthesis|nr:glycosyltransferase [Desulfovibrio sp.]
MRATGSLEELRRENALLRAALNGLRKEVKETEFRGQQQIVHEAERIRNQMQYRLGQVIVSCWRNPLIGIFTMPVLLLREYFSYLRDGFSRKNQQIRNIHLRACGGYAKAALPDLRKIADGTREAKPDRGWAALFLALGLYGQERYEEALAYAEVARGMLPLDGDRRRHLETFCLLRLRRYEEAARILARESERHGDTAEILLLRATAERNRLLASGASREEAEKEQLRCLNAIFSLHNLAPLALRDPSQTLTIANIHTPSARPCAECALKVSVLMPAHNAEATIAWSLRSLLEQTWTNLEILVADDASTDATAAIVEEIGRKDARIRLIRKEKNGGAYVARNTALALATGDLITVQDSDDWSHGQKIELQARQFVSDTSCVANISHWARLDEGLEHDGRMHFLQKNLSSLMFRREIPSLIGSWQEVRVSGDREFLERLEFFFGKGAVSVMEPARLLSIGYVRPGSLTQREGTEHFTRRTFSGIRGLYAMANAWRRDALSETGMIPATQDASWIQPVANRASGAQEARYDLIILSDFTLPGGSMRSSLHYALAARLLGMRVALRHWKKYSFTPSSAINSFVFEMCRKHGLDLLCSADDAVCEWAVVGLTSILSHLPDNVPRIRANRAIVLVNQFASTYSTGHAAQYDPLAARAHMRAVFGSEGLWIPISGRVKELMREDSRYPEPWPDPWHPLLDVGAWTEEPPVWRGREREIPVIGRHGRDADAKWPASRARLRAAYGVDAPVQTRIMGGADIAIRRLGGMPPNWEVLPFNALPAWDFLRGLDFFIHFPHEDYIEEFGRVVMEAMAVGKPAILPPVFQPTFGDAALYCEAKDVVPLVMRYWREEELYLRQTEKGREFVRKNCDLSCLRKRLEAVVAGQRVKTVACLSQTRQEKLAT